MLTKQMFSHHGDAHAVPNPFPLFYHGSKYVVPTYGPTSIMNQVPVYPRTYSQVVEGAYPYPFGISTMGSGFPEAHPYPYPFFPDGDVVPVSKEYKYEDDHVKDLLAREWRKPKAMATMPYSDPFKKKTPARRSASRDNKRRKYKDNGNHKYVKGTYPKIYFNGKSIQSVSTDEFEKALLQEIGAKVFPTMRVEPSKAKAKVNREVKRAYARSPHVRKRVSEAIRTIIDRTSACELIRIATHKILKEFLNGSPPHRRAVAERNLSRVLHLDKIIDQHVKNLVKETNVKVIRLANGISYGSSSRFNPKWRSSPVRDNSDVPARRWAHACTATSTVRPKVRTVQDEQEDSEGNEEQPENYPQYEPVQISDDELFFAFPPGERSSPILQEEKTPTVDLLDERAKTPYTDEPKDEPHSGQEQGWGGSSPAEEPSPHTPAKEQDLDTHSYDDATNTLIRNLEVKRRHIDQALQSLRDCTLMNTLDDSPESTPYSGPSQDQQGQGKGKSEKTPRTSGRPPRALFAQDPSDSDPDSYSSDSGDSDRDSDDESNETSVSWPQLPDPLLTAALQNDSDPNQRILGDYMKTFASSVRKAKRKYHQRRRSKRKKRSVNKIFYYLMKGVEAFDLPFLALSPEPMRRRKQFDSFMDRLVLVLSNVKETQNCLADKINPSPIKSNNANKALFRMLCAKVDNDLNAQLQDLRMQNQKEDGFAALMLLRQLFADTTDLDYQRDTLNTFNSVELQPGESIYRFNRRFKRLYRYVVSSGQQVSEKDRLHMYLRALRQHKDPTILYEVKAKLKDFQHGRPMLLYEVQQDLLQEEERNTGQTHGSSFADTQTVARSGRGYRGNRRTRSTRRTSTANAVNTGGSNKAKFGGPARANNSSKGPGMRPTKGCYGCGSELHNLNNCPTTSEADKKRIYQSIRRSFGGPTCNPRQNQANPSRPQGSGQSAKASVNQASAERAKKTSQPPPRSEGRSSKDLVPKGSITAAQPARKKQITYAQAAATKPTARATSYAATAFSSQEKRRYAYASMAGVMEPGQQPHQPLTEGPVPFDMDLPPPPIGEGQVVRNPSVRIAVYEDIVLIDSGASDSMTQFLYLLDLIRSAFVTVCLADGTIHECNYQGLLRISVLDIDSMKRVIVPMMDTLFVPGLRATLWSVASLCKQGHSVRFGFSTVAIVLHEGTPKELTIRVRHPMISHNGQPPMPLPWAALAHGLEADTTVDEEAKEGEASDQDAPMESWEEIIQPGTEESGLLYWTVGEETAARDAQAQTRPALELEGIGHSGSELEINQEGLVSHTGLPYTDLDRDRAYERNKVQELMEMRPVLPDPLDRIGDLCCPCCDYSRRRHKYPSQEALLEHCRAEHHVCEHPVCMRTELVCKPNSFLLEHHEMHYHRNPTYEPWTKEEARAMVNPNATFNNRTRTQMCCKKCSARFSPEMQVLLDSPYDLERHIDIHHARCYHPDCLQKGYVVFNNKLELAHHRYHEHPAAPHEDDLGLIYEEDGTVVLDHQKVVDRRARGSSMGEAIVQAPLEQDQEARYTPWQMVYQPSYAFDVVTLPVVEQDDQSEEQEASQEGARMPRSHSSQGVLETTQPQEGGGYFQEREAAERQVRELLQGKEFETFESMQRYLETEALDYLNTLEMPEHMKEAVIKTAFDHLEQAQREAQEYRDSLASRKAVSLELIHRRFGHRSTAALLLAEKNGIYRDVTIKAEPEPFCATCKISTIASTPRGGPKDYAYVTKPGQVLYLDIQPNPVHRALTTSDHSESYLTVADVKSRKFRMIGLPNVSTTAVKEALNKFIAQNKPYAGYNLTDHCEEIHVDAGSQLNSEAFKSFCENRHSIKLITAGVAHQEMNGLNERLWQACRKIAFSMCNEARLGFAYLHHALMYACRVMDVLPIKGCISVIHGEKKQACPDLLWYSNVWDSVAVGHFRVFGCPCIAKVYTRRTMKDPDRPSKKRSVLTSKNIIQRGVRGIFVGLPVNQAGWLVYIPQTGSVLTSSDVAFDEGFTSMGLAQDKLLFRDSQPVRGDGETFIDNSRLLAFTGPPENTRFDKAEIGEGGKEQRLYEDQFNFIDEFETQEGPTDSEQDSADDSSSGESDASEHEYEESTKPSPIRPWRPNIRYWNTGQDGPGQGKQYLSALRRYQTRYQDPDEPDAYDPANHPLVLHDDGEEPFPPREYNDPEGQVNYPYRELAKFHDIQELQEAYDEAYEDYTQWHAADQDWLARKESQISLSDGADVDHPIIEGNRETVGFKEGTTQAKAIAKRPPVQELRRSERIQKKARTSYVNAVVSSTVSRSLKAPNPEDIEDRYPHNHNFKKRQIAQVMAAVLTDAEPGDPGTDPSPFSPVIRSVTETGRLPLPIAKAWIKSFVKEVSGILVARQACRIEDPGPNDEVVPVMEVYRCKLDQNGMVDKLKCRIVFRGDLYQPAEPQDSWNPHASFLALKVFLALNTYFGIYPVQIDFLLAYLQANMRERVFIRFQENFKQYLPEHLHKWIGRPLLLLKALYGYNYSGKFLYQDQAEFLESQGFEQSGLPGLWIKHLEEGEIMLFLHYVDDILFSSTDEIAKTEFLAAMKARFDIEVKPRADWYLQTRVQQDKDGNILLDQSRYAKSMVTRFAPAFANREPTEHERQKYASPALTTFRYTKDDCSENQEAVEQLEHEFGFRFIELIGCFNWLSYTCFEECFAIRKLCKFMSKPGRHHFLAAVHLLHHFRCHPPKPLIYYQDITHAPVYRLLQAVEGFRGYDPFFVVFVDSSHGDNDKGRSTACDIQFLQGGLVDHNSWVPNPIPGSSAESESNAISAAVMRALYTVRPIKKVFFNSEEAGYTIPVMVDSSSAIIMNTSENPSKRTRHITSRYWYGRRAAALGDCVYIKVDGNTQNPADMGTKNLQARDTRYYRYLFEGPHLE